VVVAHPAHREDIENRDGWTSYRGPILIHASKWLRLFEILDDLERAYRGFPAPPGFG
jgi:hypothetical protein